ncbi:ankyrin repeat domain-containing protein 11-like [Sesamum indicum]|uniref:Ankyrin repeat domain-containing protein 11-like n=1 Tax=Sesamum indicum TaxID=4182 RepID=A0A6I9UHD6_SESIN|nr:ankyrin repeat domain-containing protein 11-like [Sesamum indicum]
MPRSSRHKSHKQSKHSSKDYSDSDEDVIKMKEKGSKDENSVRVHKDSASGEKRKIASQVRESKDSKDLSGNGDVLEAYVSSKRRKEKTDVGGDRWNGGGDDRGDSDRNMEREMHKGESLKVDTKSKENSNKGENMRIESKNKSKRHDSGIAGERKEDSLASVLVDKDDGKSKDEMKRKSERDSSARREGKESKDKDRRLDKEKNVGPESKSGDADDVVKKQGTLWRDFSEERQGKRSRENTERTSQDESQNPELEKEIEKRIRKKREGSSEKEKHYDDFKEGDERRLSSRGDRAKDVKYRDDKHKDGGYVDKYHEDSHKDDRRRDEKYREDADKDNKHHNDKYREGGEKDARRRDDRYRENGDRDTRRKDEKHRDDGERDGRRKDDKYREGVERESRRDEKYHEDGDRDNRCKDSRYAEDGDRDIRRSDERYCEDGDRDDRCKDNIYRDEEGRDNRHKEEKFHEDIERDIRHKDSKQGDGFDRDKRPRDTKHRDERASRDRSGDKSDPKRSRDDAYATDRHARKSSAYDDSPTHDDRAARYRDDQDRRRTNEKDDYGDIRSRGTKDQRSDADKKSARVDHASDRVRSSSRNSELEHTSSHSRRRSSPSSSSHAPRDNYRALNQDESKYRDYNYEERVRHNITSARDYAGGVGGLEKTSSSRSLEKHGQKDDGHLRSSPLQLVDKSPSSNTDRRQFGRPDVRRSIDVEESTQRSGGSQDWRGYSGKEGKGSRELGMDVLPGEELLQADVDTLSVSSPFMRNNHFSSSSRSFPPAPPFRTGVDSPLLGSAEEDSRGKSNIRHRRIGDPNMGRIQANAWRGVPNWPSPMANGFLPFPHAPPPVGFHSVMQPFPAPPMFGVRPSMELNLPAPYHIPDADRFSGPGRPMGWHNQVDDSCPPLHGWDANNAVYGEESHIYGRSDWDQSRNMPRGRGWETSTDLFKGSNRSASMEMISSEKENNSTRSGDEALAAQSIQPAQSEQTLADQQADSSDINQSIKSFGKNDIEVPLINQEDTSDVAKMSGKDDVPLCHVYLSKLDVSADLTDPELFNKCTSLIDLDPSILSDGDDSSILRMEGTEAKMVPHRSYALFVSTDDSIFQKSISLYKMQKENFWAEYGEKRKVLSKLVLNTDRGDQNAEDNKTEKRCPTDDMQGVEDALPNFGTEADHKNSLQQVGLGGESLKQEVGPPVGDTIETSKQPVSASDPVNMEETFEFDQELVEPDVKEKPLCVASVEGSDSPLPSEVKVAQMESGSNNDELKFVDTRCGALVNSDDVSSEACEAMMPESIVSGSLNLSRIHHSPESTH